MKRAILILGAGLLASCGSGESVDALPSVPTEIFPGAEAPTRFTRAYSLTESMDGKVRVFAREDGDVTDLYEMRLQPDGSWSEPSTLTSSRLLEQ